MKQINRTTFIFVLTMVSSLIVRILWINKPLLEFFPQRQVQTAEITRNIYINGWPDFWTPKVRYLTGNPIAYVLEFPLYNGIVAIFYYLLGPNIIWGRVASLIFFSLSSVIFYRLVQSTNNPASRDNQQLAILALLFFVFSPLHVLISRSFQPEELALLLLLGAIYWRSSLLMSLAALVKFPIIIFSPLVLLENINHGSTRLRSAMQLLLSLFPVVAWYIRGGEITSSPGISGNYRIDNWFQPQLWLTFQWYKSLFEIEHVLVLTSIGLLCFWIGIWHLKSVKDLLWIKWLGLGIIYLAIFNYHSMSHEYYHIFLLPPLAVFTGNGLKHILKSQKYPAARLGILLLVIFSLTLPIVTRLAAAPAHVDYSTEIGADLYRYILDF